MISVKGRTPNESGTFTVWALGLCLLLFLLCGLSIDLWRAYDARRSLHEIADIAARSGASEIDIPQRQLYNKVVLNPNLANASSRNSIEQNSQLQSVNITAERINVDVSNSEVTVELHSNFSFFLLGFLPGGSNADLGVLSSAKPFED